MQEEPPAWPDWRDSAAYAPLLGADRSLFAWEWLRRDCRYRSAAARALWGRASRARAPRPEAFGLAAFEPPHLAVPHARPVWTAAAHPYVLRAVVVAPGAPEDRFALDSVRSFARVVETGTAAHLLLSDGLRSIRLDAPAQAFAGGPVRLRYLLEGAVSAQAPLLALRRLLALCRDRRFSASLHPREARSRRWVLMLRVHDALAAGASQRDIAAELLSASVSGGRWRTREPSVRSQAQRLVRGACRYGAGAYRQFLR